MLAAHRRSGVWHVQTTTGMIETPYLINAAGAWCDAVAKAAGVKPLGLMPLRRTAVTFEAPDETAHWPYFGDITESFYVKPDAGRLLASPCDQTPVEPSDVAPDEYDVAVIADRVERMTSLAVKRILSKWAGLRTFSPDRTPVAGWAPDVEGFFWLAGQGGYGIQTAPAMAHCCKSLMLDKRLPADLTALGILPSNLSPQRFHTTPNTVADEQVHVA